MAFAAFADAPVDVAVVEVGMGGRWDATNVIDAAGAVVTPGRARPPRAASATRSTEIAAEKAGIVHAGAPRSCGVQPLEAAEVLLRRAAEVGAELARRGRATSGSPSGSVARRRAAAHAARASADATTTSSCRCTARTRRTTPPARSPRSRRSSAAGERRARRRGRAGRASRCADSPGRLEVVRRTPTVLLDGAHNPGGVRGAGGGAGRGVRVRRAGRRGRRAGRQGRAGDARAARTACSTRSS